jgi:hypothetical protein
MLMRWRNTLGQDNHTAAAATANIQNNRQGQERQEACQQ